MKKNYFWSKTKGLFVDRRTILASAAAAGAAASFKINPVGFAKAQGAGEVTFYTSMPQKYSNPAAETFNNTVGKEKGITAKVFYSPGFKTYQRAQAEYAAGRVQHDVIMLSDASLFKELKADGHLMGYVSPHVDQFPKSHQDPDGTWCNGRTLVMMYCYNKARVENGEKFKGWKDFTDSQYKGRLGVSSALTAGTAFVNYVVTREHPDLGLDFWKEVAALNANVQSSHGKLTQMCLAGQLPVTVNLDYNVYVAREREGAPLVSVFPNDVTAVPIIPLSPVKQAPNPEGAKIFYDWWLSKEGQEAVRDANAIYSPRPDVDPLPGMPRFSEIPAVTPDVDHLDQVREQYQAEFKEMFNL